MSIPRQPDRQGGSSPPTICHVLHTLNVGGAEILARQFAERSAGEFRVVFACLDELGSMGLELRAAGWTVEVLHRRPGFDLRCARRLRGFLREQRVDLVHAHQYAPFFYASLSRVRRSQRPIVFTEHGRDYPDYRRWKRVWANRFFLGPQDRVIAVGQCVRQALMDFEGFPSDRVAVIYNGVDVDRYGTQADHRSQVRQEWGIAEHEPVVIQVARLNRLKDHATAFRAVRELKQRGVAMHLVVVGDGEEREPLAKLVEELGVRDQVRMLGLRGDVPRLLQAADIFLLSSITEGIPLTLIEAMLAELPCVATRVGGNEEVLVDGETGYLAEPSHPNALADALEKLLRSPDRWDTMGVAGHRRAERLFDDRTMHDAYRQVYRESLNLPHDKQSLVASPPGGGVKMTEANSQPF